MSHSYPTYPSDISREQFARILPTLESARRRRHFTTQPEVQPWPKASKRRKPTLPTEY